MGSKEMGLIELLMSVVKDGPSSEAKENTILPSNGNSKGVATETSTTMTKAEQEAQGATRYNGAKWHKCL